MNPNFYKNNPFRPLKWRAYRAQQLVAQQPNRLRPQPYDDQAVRDYWQLLTGLLDAGDNEEQLDRLTLKFPDVYQAHQIYYSTDIERRQILEARLLTKESSAQIAARMDIEPSAIDYFETLFFNIRDRLECLDWIVLTTLRLSQDGNAKQQGIMTAEERGYVYRFFAFHGGPLVLDECIRGLSSTAMCLPTLGDLAAGNDVLHGAMRWQAAAAVVLLQIDRNNIMPLLKLTLGTGKAIPEGTAGSQSESDYLNKCAEYLGSFLAQGTTPK